MTSGAEKLARLRDAYYISAKDAALGSGISYSFMRTLLMKGRVTGAYKIGTAWAVPCNWKHKRPRKKVPGARRRHRPWIDKAPVTANLDPSLYSEAKVKIIRRQRHLGTTKLSKKFNLRKNVVWNILHNSRSKWDKKEK